MKRFFKKLFLALLIGVLLFSPISGAKTPWTSKPPIGAEIDWGHPLSQSLSRCILIRGPESRKLTDIVVNDVLTWKATGNSPNSNVGRFGRQVAHIASNPGSGWAGVKNVNYKSQSFSVSALFRIRTPNGFLGNTPFFSTRSSSDSPLLDYNVALGSNLPAFVVNGDSLLLGARGPSQLSTGVYYRMVGTFKRDSSIATYLGTWTLYLDGKQIAQNNWAPYLRAFSFTDKPALILDGSPNNDVDLVYLMAWNRWLSPSEVKQLYSEPYCFLKAPTAWSNFATAVAETARRIFMIQ